jgi:hypothetical protein
MFRRLFLYLEERDKSLVLSDSIQLYCLQVVFQQRIESLLQEWASAWNNHPMEGCGNLSPLQMRTAGLMQRFRSSDSHIRDVFDVPLSEPEDDYGVDPDILEHDLSDDDNDDEPEATSNVQQKH